jgi:hypothetical protein
MRSESRPATAPARRRKRAIIVVIVVLGIVGAIGLVAWSAYRLDQLVERGKAVRDRYEALAAAMPFSPPTAGERPATERIEKMLAVRHKMLEAIPPETAAAARRVAETTGMGRVGMTRLALAHGAGLETAAASAAGALESEGMSPVEYQWLLGTLVAEALLHGEDDPVAADYRRTAERLARPRGGAERTAAVAAAQLDAVRRRYDAWRPAEGRMADRLKSDHPLAAALDLLVLSTEGEGGA